MNMFWVQLLPLLVFIVVDMIFSNTVVSILSAVIFAIFQMVFTFVKTGTPDYMVLIDVGLITILGGISIKFENDLFFKLKPAIIEGITIIIMIVFLFSPDTFIIKYFSRFMVQKPFNPAMVPILKKIILFTIIYTFIHILAVCYTAFYASRKMWAFVAGPGFYFIFIPVLIIFFIKKFFKRQKASDIKSYSPVTPNNKKENSLQ